MSAPVYNVSVGGNNNDSNVILGSANGSIAEDDIHDHTNLANKVAVLENALNLNSTSDLAQDALVATNASGVATNASGVATNLTRLDFHEALVLKNIDDISLNKSNLAVLENSKIDKLATINSIMANSLDNVSHEVFNTTSNLWSKNATNNELTYTGLEYNIADSLISSKDLTLADGFNFSCKVTLVAADGSPNVLGYNASAGIVAGFPTISASGTSETELVMVKDQDISGVRVWIDGVEDKTTNFPDFTGGRLVVLANPNATFSEIKLTDTKYELPDFYKLTKTKSFNLNISTVDNPIDQDFLNKVSALQESATLWNGPSEAPYWFAKLGASVYFRMNEQSIEDNRINMIYYYNRPATAGVIYGGNTNFGGTNISMKIYTRDVPSVNEILNTTGFLTFEEFTQETREAFIAQYMSYGFSREQAIDYWTTTVSSWSPLSLYAFGGFPPPPIINLSPSMVWTNELSEGTYTERDLWFLNRLNVPEEQEYVVSDDNNSYLHEVHLPIDTLDNIKMAAVKILTGEKLSGMMAGLWPIPNSAWSTTDPLVVYSVSPSTTEINFSNAGSFPTRAEWDANGLSSFYAPYVTALGGDAAAETTFDALSFKEFIEQFLFLNTNTVKFEALPTIVDFDDLVATISAPGGALELSANESLYFNITIIPPFTPGPRDSRILGITRLPSDLSTLNNYTGAINYLHVFNPDNGVVIDSKLQDSYVKLYTTDKTKVLNSFKASLAAVSGGSINVDAILDSGKGLYGQLVVESGVNPRVYTWLYDLRESDNPKYENFVYSPYLLGGSIETMPSNDWLKDSDLTQQAQNAINAFLQDPTQFAGLFAPGVAPVPLTGTAYNNPQIVSDIIGAFLFTNPTAQQEWTNYIASLGENPLVEYNAAYSSLENMRTAFQARPESENTIDPIFDITS